MDKDKENKEEKPPCKVCGSLPFFIPPPEGWKCPECGQMWELQVKVRRYYS